MLKVTPKCFHLLDILLRVLVKTTLVKGLGEADMLGTLGIGTGSLVFPYFLFRHYCSHSATLKV